MVEHLRAAGLVVLGKTNLSEWANYRSTGSISGWSAVGGLTPNPHDRSRSACGSSSGSGAAVAAGLASLAVGTETDGSIICPAAFCGVVGLKPTLGLVPTAGVIPISRSQDVVGPMTRTVRDAALLLAAMSGHSDAAGLDPAASTTDRMPLIGLRVGLPRVGVWTKDERLNAVVEAAVSVLESLGVTVVDPVQIASLGEIDEADELAVLDHELKVGLAEYLATRPPGGPRSLADLIAFNRDHAEIELALFDQDIFERAEATTGLDAAAYRRGPRALPAGRPHRTAWTPCSPSTTSTPSCMPSADLAFELATENDGGRDEGADYAGGRPSARLRCRPWPAIRCSPSRAGSSTGSRSGSASSAGANSERVLLRLGHAYEMAAFGPAGSAAAFPPQ